MLSQASGPVLDPPAELSPFRSRPAPLVGARRMFPAHFKLQVLDAYRYDNECKGNQRATARKFNVHRRQIQKWLQCEHNLRASVADALQYTADSNKLNLSKIPSSDNRLPEPTTRVFKHDARTLKLVAQKLYPSTSGAIYKDDQKGDLKKLRVSPCFVPNEKQLNDFRSEAMGRPLLVDNSVYKFNMKNSSGLIIKDRVTPTSPPMMPALPAPKPLPPISTHRPIYPPVSLPYSDEPYNLVKSVPTTPPTVPRPPPPKTGLPVGAVAASTSPLPARVAEIVADSKTSAFSPKRKWLNESLQDRNNENSPPQPSIEPKQKKPCPDFSIERLCGFNEKKKEENFVSPVPFSYPPHFPPPLVLQNRSIPELASLHFKPDVCEPVVVKEENISDDEEQIDVTSTTPLEEKSFDFPDSSAEGKRRSFSVQFKLNVLDAFYHDKDCNQNQRATARKFNINRRQVQKWLNLEDSLRGEGCHKCPRHCTVNLQPCSEPSCLQELPPQLCSNWATPGSFQLPIVPWYLSYGVNGVY